ncbi:hypothetical protein ACK6T9_05405 [Proteus vulgaris]|uniref:hypothetical protein n=1 Tax=Proteus vulgaris TaxID=585 RepID=UPI0039B4C6F9
MKKFLKYIKNKKEEKLKSKPLWSKPKYSRDIKALIVKILLIFLSMIGLFATLYSLLDTANITNTSASIISVVLLLMYCYLVYYEFSTLDGKYTFKQSDTISIRNYMLYWIAYGNRVAIWTRDMSWVKDEESKNLLLEKAKNKELIICLPTHTDFSEELQEKGAEVYVYGTELLNSPSARFTIAHYGRDWSKVAIGRAAKSNKHVIEEFDSGSHPAFSLANELVEIAMKTSKKINGNQT